MTDKKIKDALKNMIHLRDHLYELDLGNTDGEKIDEILADGIDAINELIRRTRPVFHTTVTQTGGNCSFINNVGTLTIGGKTDE